MRNRRGSTLTESAIVLAVFAILLAGLMELAFMGFAGSSVTYAAHRAARFAAVRGSTAPLPATIPDIRSQALTYLAPLDTASATVSVTWTPDNNPGSTVEVNVAYSLRPALLPLSSGVITLRSTARRIIAQ